MRVVLVTSSVLYVRDNYLSFLETVTNSENLPEGVEIAGIMIIKTHSPALLMKAVSLFFLSAPDMGFTLLKNWFRAVFLDKRKKMAGNRKIPVFEIENINRKSSRELLKGLKPDLIVNARTRNIYRKKTLEIPEIGCINIHHGLLPEQRGTFCDLWALFRGEPAGFSIHWMNERVDDGEIIMTEQVETCGIVKYLDLPMKSGEREAGALLRVLKEIEKSGRKGIENRSDGIIKTKNPDIRQIREIRKRGIIL